MASGLGFGYFHITASFDERFRDLKTSVGIITHGISLKGKDISDRFMLVCMSFCRL